MGKGNDENEKEDGCVCSEKVTGLGSIGCSN